MKNAVRNLYCVFILLIAFENKLQAEWENYYQITRFAEEPRLTLYLAQQYFDCENKLDGIMVDLGTGTGRDALYMLKDQFVIEYLQIDEGVMPKANGEMKYWHTFHVVAKKVG